MSSRSPVVTGTSSQPTTTHAVTPPGRPLAGAGSDRGPTPIGWAFMRAVDQPGLALLVELDNSVPRVTQGYGGFEEVDRRQRISLTDWTGFKPVGIELDLYFDDFDAGRSVEGAIDVLEALAGRGRLAPGGKPPAIIVDTAGVMPFDYSVFPGEQWVVNDLAWADSDDENIVNEYGNRVRASVTVSLLQYVTASRLRDQAIAARRKTQQQTNGAARRLYTVHEGETLITIARKKLGDAGRWPELARLNRIRDPRAVRPGAVIRLP